MSSAFHTHAFPDRIAEKAIPLLEQEADVKAFLDGRLQSLLESMDNAGIQRSVVCSIATKPSQFYPILEWSKEITSDRIIPLPSIHPADDDLKDKVRIIHEYGFKGIKLHPYYQEFKIDEERLFPVYEGLQEYGLFLVCHTGFDIAFPWDRIADPVRIAAIIKRFPQFKFITTHFGAWQDWDEVEKYLLGKNIYMEISYTFGCLERKRIKHFFLTHPSDYILFGTDSPWGDQKQSLDTFYSYKLEKEWEEKILYRNAQELLNG
jgi:predicted TIM-barrel fold metal-dependent hydrolase